MSNNATLTLRVLARLLGYPDAELRAHLGELSAALHSERTLGHGRLAELDALKVELFGKKGAVTAQLKTLGTLTPG